MNFVAGPTVLNFNLLWHLQARKEREALAAEGGWTVVVHHKGRKKTTDTETGITVGSVAQAAVLENMSKKKNKEVGVDFYRFQKREAQRNGKMYLINIIIFYVSFLGIIFIAYFDCTFEKYNEKNHQGSSAV